MGIFLTAHADNNVTLQLLWKHQFQFAGYYVAKEKGFYKNVGLNVDIKQFSNEVQIVEDVLNDKADFAVGRSSILIKKGNGAPITALYATFQETPLMLITRGDITQPGQLKDKRIMMTNDASDVAEIQALMMKYNINQNDFVRQKHSFNIEDLINKKTDAMGAYISNEPYQMIMHKQPYSMIQPANYGFNMYSDILFTATKTVENKPDMTHDFVNASIKGWLYAFEHIEETANLIYGKYNTQNRTLDALIYEGNALKKLAFTEDKQFGELDLARFESMANIYLINGLLNPNYNIDNFIYQPYKPLLNTSNKTVAIYTLLLAFAGFIICVQLYRYFAIKKESEIFQEIADHDQLTGLVNRHGIQSKINEYFNLSNRYDLSLCCLFSDIDHFKLVNDKFGHLTGDHVLKEFSDLLRQHIRASDAICRWGGEEFLIILPNTELKAAIETAEKLCAIVNQHTFKKPSHMTCSFGVTNYVANETIESFVDRADKALYNAKRSGRNCVKSIKG